MTARARAGAVLVALAWSFAGCSVDGTSDAPAGQDAAPNTSSLTDAIGTTPSGAAPAAGTAPAPDAGTRATFAPVATAPGSPAVCGALAGSPPLRGLGEALAGLAAADTTAASNLGLRSAAKALRDLSGQASADLRRTFSESAAALDRLADSGASDPTALEVAGSALGRLSDEVQLACNFRLG